MEIMVLICLINNCKNSEQAVTQRVIQVSWYENRQRFAIDVTSDTQLLLLLDWVELLRSKPSLIDLTDKVNKCRLTIGVGSADSVALFQEGDKRGRSFTSLSSETSEGVLVFEYCGQYTEIEKKHLIHPIATRMAAIQFCLTGDRPTIIHWIED